jgi:acylphosphatase
MSQQAALHAVVHGLVQGVNFRYFVLRNARSLGLAGYTANRYDGTVEVVVEGEKGKLEELLKQLEVGPRSARVKRVDANWSEFSGKYRGFDVRY